MKTINLRGFNRENTGKAATNRLRKDGWVPCELYGAGENKHFAAFIADFKDLIYTPETHKVHLDINGAQHEAVIKEVQFHPLNEDIIHVDFMVINEDRQIKLKLPIRFMGTAVGVREGGKLIKKLRFLNVKGFPKDMPDAIEVDMTNVGLGKSVRVSEVVVSNLEVLNAPSNPIATVDVPRGLKGKEEDAAAAAGKAAPAAKAAAPAKAAAAPAAKK